MSERLTREPPAPVLQGALWRDDRFAYLGAVWSAAIDAAGVPRVWVGGQWVDVSGSPWAEAVYRAAWAAERVRARAGEDALRATTSAHAASSSAPAPVTASGADVAPAPPPWRGDVRYLGRVDGRWSLLAWSDVLGRHVAREWSAADQWWRLADEHRREAIYDAAFQHERAQAARLARKRDEAYGEVKTSLGREDALRASLAIVATGAEGVWRWQGDGHDHPESLSCPVVMSADTLRAIFAERGKTRITHDVGDLAPVFAYVNEHHQGEYHAGERLAVVLLRLLARLPRLPDVRRDADE